MTKDEFYSIYLKLHKRYPDQFKIDNPSKLRSLFEMMQSLEKSWWASLVARILLTNNPKLSIFQAVDGELKSRSQKLKTIELLSKPLELSDQGLEKTLSEMGVSSLLDAVLKR